MQPNGMIFWDWNGTLMDDVDFTHGCLNWMLESHGYPQRYDLAQYRELFGENRHPFTDIHLTSVYSRFDTKDIHNSYHGFRGRCKGRRPIDYIFVSDDFQIQDAYLDTSSLDGRYPSDHFPLVAVLSVRKKAAE